MLWNWIQNGLLKSCLTLTQEWNDSWIPISPSGIFDDAWDPNISCTQKIKPNILKLCFSHTDSASQITHFTHPTKFYCLSFSCSWRLWAQKALSSGKKTLSREERSQAFHCHSHVSAVNLISVRNKNYLRIPQDQEQFQSFLESARYVFSVCFPQKGHEVIEAIKSKVKLIRSMPLLLLLFPIASKGKSRTHKADIEGLNI